MSLTDRLKKYWAHIVIAIAATLVVAFIDIPTPLVGTGCGATCSAHTCGQCSIVCSVGKTAVCKNGKEAGRGTPLPRCVYPPSCKCSRG